MEEGWCGSLGILADITPAGVLRAWDNHKQPRGEDHDESE